MNSDFFNLAGYISVLLWVLVPVVWLVYGITGPRRLLCPIALVLAIAAVMLAKHNSKNYVNLIQPDRTEEIAAQQAREEATRKAALESLGQDVSDVRFAEDTATDSLDRAGLNQDDLKYMDAITGSSSPAWKNEKKSRSAGGADDGSIEAAVGGGNAIKAANSDVIDEMQEETPVTMNEKDLAMANRLDALNLKIIYCLIALAIVMVIIDYLKRANMHGKESFALPIPSSLLNNLTPLPPVVERPEPADLAQLIKRGDSFVYLTDNKQSASNVPESFPCIPFSKKRVDVLRANEELATIDNDFIFETLWFGRSSFVVDSAARSEQLVERFIELLIKRKETRAKLKQTVHVIWDIETPMPKQLKENFSMLAKATGFSLYLNSKGSSTQQSTAA
jgi:hypothetical protein